MHRPHLPASLLLTLTLASACSSDPKPHAEDAHAEDTHAVDPHAADASHADAPAAHQDPPPATPKKSRATTTFTIAARGGAQRKADIEAAFKTLYAGKGVLIHAASCDEEATSADTFGCALEQTHGPTLQLTADIKDSTLNFKPTNGEPASLDLDALNAQIADTIKAESAQEASATCGHGTAFFPVAATFSCKLLVKDQPEQAITIKVRDAEGNISWETVIAAPPTPHAAPAH
jgi:hypothetical protein